MNIGEMQRKLSLKAEKDKEHRFADLYNLLYDPHWLRLAHDRVAENAGSITAGCDGFTMATFGANLEGNLDKLADELKAGTFEPYPVRRVYIPKANGKKRPLGIPSIRDRIVQEALRMVLEPIFEADFDQHSFGFRPNRRTQDAIQCVMSYTTERKKFFWIIEGDISSYFDTINHKRLIKLLRRRIRDEDILDLIWKFLRSGVMERKLFKDTLTGAPQGGILSPLLANIYLNELDTFMRDRGYGIPQEERTARRRNGLANFGYARYADDFVVMCNGSKAQAEAFKEELYEFLSQNLRLNTPLSKRCGILRNAEETV